MEDTALAPANDRIWAIVAQLSPYVSTFIGPVVVLLLFQGRPFARYHATQALALQGALWLAGLVISAIAGATCGLGAVLYLALVPFALAPLWGAWKAYNGEWAGFPLIDGIGK